MFDLKSILGLLPVVGPAVAALPEFKKVYDQIVDTFHEKDQAVLKAAGLSPVSGAHVLSSGGYDSGVGGISAIRAMTGGNKRKAAKLPTPPALGSTDLTAAAG